MTNKTLIQRYMSLEKFKWLLEDKALYLTKMSVFDDKLEGGLTAPSYFMNSNDLKILDKAMNIDAPPVDETKEQREVRQAHSSAVSQRLRERTFDTPFGNYNSDDISSIFPVCREHIYVSCWHKSPHECLAMWKLYGSSENAVCIVSTIQKLKESIQSHSLLDTLLFEDTDYIDHDNAKFSKCNIAPFKSKSLPYSFEKEFRVIGYDSNVNLNNVAKNDLKGVNIPINSLSQLIEKVVISPEAEETFINEVNELCISVGLEVEHSSLRQQPINDFWTASKSHLNSGL